MYRKFDHAGSLTVERQTVHISDDTGRIAMLEKRTIGTDDSEEELVRYIYSNHLQSASLELDETGAIISYEEYHPYGTTAYQAMNALIKATAKRYRYTGKERDEESGLYYHGARYYIPWLCRWSASDPLESKYAGMSPYNYGNCNPVTFNDPSGMQWEQPKEGQYRKREFVIGYEMPDPGVTIPIKSMEQHYYHRGSENHKSGWYSPSEYKAITKEVMAGVIYATDELSLGSDMWGGKEAKAKAAEAADDFIEANKGHISVDFFSLLASEGNNIKREYKWKYGDKQSGIVYLTDSPIDYFAGSFLKGLGKAAVKGSELLSTAFRGSLVSSINSLNNKLTMKFVEEGLQNSLKKAYMQIAEDTPKALIGPNKFPRLDVKFVKHGAEWSQWGSISKVAYAKRAANLADSKVAEK